MEELEKLQTSPERASNAAILAKVNAIMLSQEEIKGEVRHLRDVVIGNGNSASLLNQVKQLEFGQAIAKSDRVRMEKQIIVLTECSARIEKDEITSQGLRKNFSNDQERVLIRLDAIETTQKEHGTLIAAFRNRVIGIVAMLSLLAGTGVGFAIAAKLLSAAIP